MGGSLPLTSNPPTAAWASAGRRARSASPWAVSPATCATTGRRTFTARTTITTRTTYWRSCIRGPTASKRPAFLSPTSTASAPLTRTSRWRSWRSTAWPGTRPAAATPTIWPRSRRRRWSRSNTAPARSPCSATTCSSTTGATTPETPTPPRSNARSSKNLPAYFDWLERQDSAPFDPAQLRASYAQYKDFVADRGWAIRLN